MRINVLQKNACLIFLAMLFVQEGQAQVKVKVNLDVKHKLGEVETFDRQKFINFHTTIDQSNWDSENEVSDLRDELLNKYDVYAGRNTGGITWPLKNQITEDPSRPGYADPASIASNGATRRNQYAQKTDVHPYEERSDMILCTQLHPFYPDGKTTNKGWAFSQADTEQEPFGTASGEFFGRFIKEYFGSGGTTGKPKPAYVEVVNEPLWDLVTIADNPEDLTKIFKFHKTVAQQVRQYNPDIPVGGYCAAFPDFDKNNFQRWHNRWKLFVDVAGAEMDYWTIHMYDFPSIGGKKKYRKGSNMEATMDMIEQYSYMTLGEVKPLMISEYNAQTHDYNNEGWSGYRDWLKIKSTNSMMMQYMERANNINIAMPFIMLKSEWQYNENVGPASVHGSRMLRRENEPVSYTGDFVFTDLVKIYQLWSDVKGTRVDSKTGNLDILSDAYVDGNKAYVIVNNLTFNDVNLNLQVDGVDAQPSNIEVRHLYLQGGEGGNPVLDSYDVTEVQDGITLKAEGTYIFTYTYSDDITIDKLSEEKKYYADTYLQPINGNTAVTFNVNGVEKGSFGEAILRVGVGRDHGKELKPDVSINGEPIPVPSNFRGGPQTDRDNFFGVLEIPVSLDQIDENNVIEITFPDGGGFVSTVTMQVFNFSQDFRDEDTAIGEESKQIDLKVFPNPANRELRVSLNDPNILFDIEIHNMEGKKVYESVENRGDKLINTNSFGRGHYLVSIINSDVKNVRKIFVN